MYAKQGGNTIITALFITQIRIEPTTSQSRGRHCTTRPLSWSCYHMHILYIKLHYTTLSIMYVESVHIFTCRIFSA